MLKLFHNGYWELLLNSHVILGTGKINQKKPGDWHNLKIICQGDLVGVEIDGKLLKSVKRTSNVKQGMVGIGCSWDKVRFDNLEITPASTINTINVDLKWSETNDSQFWRLRRVEHEIYWEELALVKAKSNSRSSIQ